MTYNKKENFEAVRQFCLLSNQSALLFGGSGDGGTVGSGGSGTGESEDPPPIWYDPKNTSSSQMASPNV
ncbi:hypothetical protein AB9P05_23990 [Roseivirga sp. BDSF3-8]|uniref:hypothetical protein n=1 Tax=Roseivirga sp. BDSF3-8 TaxID=3241598 RepID=UPI003531EC4E